MRLPDFLTRLHAPTKATTLGVGGVLLASLLYFLGSGQPVVHEVLIALFLFVTAPVSALMLARAALRLGLPSRAQLPEEPPEKKTGPSGPVPAGSGDADSFLRRRRSGAGAAPGLQVFGEVVVRRERVRREHEPFRRDTFAPYARCESSTFLKNGFFADSSFAISSQALRKAIRISGGVRRIWVPCLVRISSIASAFCFCHLIHQRMKVSLTATRTASCCCGVKPAQTSELMISSPIEADSCMPGV